MNMASQDGGEPKAIGADRMLETYLDTYIAYYLSRMGHKNVHLRSPIKLLVCGLTCLRCRRNIGPSLFTGLSPPV
jgi:hypothetical protein